jgi:2-oxoisovalerate dehydrogenase E1 component
VIEADAASIAKGQSIGIITYGRGVYWAKNAAKNYKGQVEIIDLRTLQPLDEELMYATARRHGRCLVVTEEPVSNSFAQSLAARISDKCFEALDAPVRVIGSEDMPAIPLNSTLEATMIPSEEKVSKAIGDLLGY